MYTLKQHASRFMLIFMKIWKMKPNKVIYTMHTSKSYNPSILPKKRLKYANMAPAALVTLVRKYQVNKEKERPHIKHQDGL
jgi:hypothetical protein